MTSDNDESSSLVTDVGTTTGSGDAGTGEMGSSATTETGGSGTETSQGGADIGPGGTGSGSGITDYTGGGGTGALSDDPTMTGIGCGGTGGPQKDPSDRAPDMGSGLSSLDDQPRDLAERG